MSEQAKTSSEKSCVKCGFKSDDHAEYKKHLARTSHRDFGKTEKPCCETCFVFVKDIKRHNLTKSHLRKLPLAEEFLKKVFPEKSVSQ